MQGQIHVNGQRDRAFSKFTVFKNGENLALTTGLIFVKRMEIWCKRTLKMPKEKNLLSAKLVE